MRRKRAKEAMKRDALRDVRHEEGGFEILLRGRMIGLFGIINHSMISRIFFA